MSRSHIEPLVTHGYRFERFSTGNAHHRPTTGDLYSPIDAVHFFGSQFFRNRLADYVKELETDIKTRCLGHDRCQAAFRLYPGFPSPVEDLLARGSNDPADAHMSFLFSPYGYGDRNDTLQENDNFAVAEQTVVFLGDMDFTPWGF